jgi:DHA2 family multidrug resistance protein
VFLGAGFATLNSRLLSVALTDLRGALGLSFDDASWLPTALNMATMFSGVFVVFLNAFWGRGESSCRWLLYGLFSVAALCHMLRVNVASGCHRRPFLRTFYSLTMTFVLTTLPKRLIIFEIACASTIRSIALAVFGRPSRSGTRAG